MLNTSNQESVANPHEKINKSLPPTGCYYEGSFPMLSLQKTDSAMGLTVKGILSKYACPEIDLIFDFGSNSPIKVKAIIDTGAFHNHVKHELMLSLQVASFKTETQSHPIHGFFEANLFSTSFKISGIDKVFSSDFYQIQGTYMYDVIIGTEFLSQCKKFTYNGKKKIYTLEL